MGFMGWLNLGLLLLAGLGVVLGIGKNDAMLTAEGAALLALLPTSRWSPETREPPK